MCHACVCAPEVCVTHSVVPLWLQCHLAPQQPILITLAGEIFPLDCTNYYCMEIFASLKQPWKASLEARIPDLKG